MKYMDWLCDWLDNYVYPTAKIRTRMRYKEIVDGHIVGTLGRLELCDITPIVLQKFAAGLSSSGNLKTGKGLSANSVNAIISVLQSSLKTAYAAGLTDTYVADRIKRPRAESQKTLCFTAEEQRKIENAILGGKDSDYMFGVVLCLYTGLRIGELLALEWSDIDFERGILSVTKSSCYVKSDGGYARVVDRPKTVSSERVIPLPQKLTMMLLEKKRSSSATCVVSRHDRAVSVRTYQSSFCRLLSSLGIQHKGFHSLRHTFATRAVECGMDVKTLSEILGHKNSAVTLNRYVHSLPEHKKEMMNRVVNGLWV